MVAQPGGGTRPAWSLDALADWLAQTLGIDGLAIERASRLGGGAIQENWLLNVVFPGEDAVHRWVLRTSAPRSLRVSHDRSEEFRLLQLAHRTGLTVPEPLADCSDVSVIGKGFCVMQWRAGIAQARRLVRDAALPEWGGAVVQDVARNLAGLHALPADAVQTSMPFLGEPGGSLGKTPGGTARDQSIDTTPVSRRIAEHRSCLDDIPTPQPVLEYVLNWLEARQPGNQQWVLLHGDCRTGNLLVHEGRLSALLDWEFAGLGDPREDLGWFCAPCWRFGNDELGAGGLADVSVLLDAYRDAGGLSVTPAELEYWQILGETRWAVIALLQAERCYTGGERTLELALTDRLVPALEASILQAIARAEGEPEAVERNALRENAAVVDAAVDNAAVRNAGPGQGDRPASESPARHRILLDAARQDLRTVLMPGLEGERKYVAALLSRALEVLQAELAQPAESAHRHTVDALIEAGVAPAGSDWASIARLLREQGASDPRYRSVFQAAVEPAAA